MFKTNLLFLFLLCVPGLSFSLFAQDYSYANYTVKDGLAGSTVYSMVRDKDGFIWFGTETGLSRFDGTHFKNFYTTDGLPDNEIIKLFVDSKNRVWIVPFKNSLCYYREGRIHTRENDPLLEGLKIESEVISIIEDGAGNLLIAEAKSVHIIAPDGTITNIEEFAGKPIQVVQAGLNKRLGFRMILMSRRGDIFVDQDAGKFLLTGNIDSSGPNNYSSTYISPQLEMLEDKDSLMFFNTLDSTTFHILMPKGFLNVSRINDSCITINTYTATFLLNIPRKRILDSFLIGQTVNGVIEDAEGGMWFSTLGAGVHRLGTTDVLSYTFRIRNTIFPVFSIQKFDSTLYVGTDHFLLWVLGHKGKSLRNVQIYNRFSRGRITTMARLDKKKMLIGTDAGVFQFAGLGKRTELIWQRGSVKSLAIISDTTALDCSGLNARVMRTSDGKTISTLWKARSTCGCLQNGTYYIGTLNGLFAINEDKETVFLGDQYKVFQSRIAAVQPAADGALWVATESEGLAAYKEGKLIARINGNNGLTSNVCRTIFISGKDIWVGTDKGLNKIIVSDSGYKIVQFTTADGLSSDIINAIYVEGNKVFAGTSEGITWFNENRVSRRSVCNLRVTRISVAGKDWPADTTGFTVPHKDNDLRFEFVGISFKSAGHISYKYRLTGLDHDWKVTDQTSLYYPSLPSGSYELQVFAINRFGVTSNKACIKFIVDTLIWERAWFRILCLSLIGVLIWLLFHFRVSMIRKKEAEKSATAAKIAELEQMALRSQMNPHFIFNCLNSIQLYVMDKDTRGANEFITNFSRLIRHTLDISAKPRVSLHEEVNYISTYLELEKRRFEGKFVYTIFVDPDIDRQECTIPPMILQPYIENSIIHGVGQRQDEKGRIRISMEAGPDHIICMIEDNGVGRKLAAQYKGRNLVQYQSRGMEMTAKRINMLNIMNKFPILITIEDLEDHDHKPAGTRVMIHFPLQEIPA